MPRVKLKLFCILITAFSSILLPEEAQTTSIHSAERNNEFFYFIYFANKLKLYK